MIITALYITYVVLSSQYTADKPPPQEPIKIEEPAPEISRSEIVRYEKYRATSYDLGISACGKDISDPEYGLTSSGVSLIDKKFELGDRYIAADPKNIPYGSKVKIIFLDKKYYKYNGTYECVDTGSALKGKKIVDIFIGDFKQKKESDEVRDFGITDCLICFE